MKKKNKLWFLYPIVLLLMIAIIYFGSDLLAIYKTGLTKTYIAKASLPQRTVITDDLLEEVKVPKEYVKDNAFVNKEEIIGKYVKLNSYIPKGSLFYKEALDDIESMKDSAHAELKDDEITFDLFAKKIAVNPAHLLKGMNVDLYLTINKKELESDLLISNAKIIGLYDVNNKEIKDYDKDSKLGTISIAIKKDMVPYLNKALAIGDVSLLVGSNLYKNKVCTMNDTSEVFKLLK